MQIFPPRTTQFLGYFWSPSSFLGHTKGRTLSCVQHPQLRAVQRAQNTTHCTVCIVSLHQKIGGMGGEVFFSSVCSVGICRYVGWQREDKIHYHFNLLTLARTQTQKVGRYRKNPQLKTKIKAKK